jgi:ubiquinone/menaquinone biosynthesis C-methylase UbiE
MALENITICPICDQHLFSPYLTAKDYTITGEEFSLVQCTHCNFIITSPRPDKEAIAPYYASDKYISHSGKSKTLFDKIYLLARSITLKWKHNLIKQYSPQPGTILDFGCGTGDFLNYQKNKGWNIIGLEPNDSARQKANNLLINKVSKDLNSIANKSLTIITLWHVLEHIHDLNKTISELKPLLTTDGFMIIAVPNHNSHDCKKYGKHWAAYDVPRHLWHFTKETMNSLLTRNGLQIVEVKPMKLDSYYVSLLSETYKNPNQKKPITSFKAFCEGLISNLSARKNNEYSSLIYIVRIA